MVLVVPELAIGVTVVGYFVSPHITRLMEIARSRAASSKYRLSWCVKKKLKKLAQDLDDINGFLDPDRMEFVNDRTWLDRLWRLKDAIHDAEEILDLFESHVLELEAARKQKKKHQGGAISSSSRKSIYSSRFGIKKGPSLGQLNEVLKNLAELRERARELNQDPGTRRAVLSSLISREGMGPKPVRDKQLFFGYNEEYKQLVSMLLDGKVDSKKVIVIIGHGGMGKTELARQAFREVQSEFNLLLWVPAYGKTTQFDLLAEIWKSAAVGTKSVTEMNIPSLQRKLEELWTSKKCLLVLDDVWNDERAINENRRKEAWDALSSVTGLMERGSKIVMTTRAKICTTQREEASIVLNGIRPEEISLLLNAELRTDGDGTSRGDRRIQELLSSQLLRFKGSPLAAVEIGKELKKQTPSDTRCNILNNMEDHMVSVFKGHLFTYQHLPPHLQRCFAFCSIFPYSWRFEREKLTKMWMALGFVEENNTHGLCGTSSMEDIARGYFDSLVDRSLFQLEEACGSSMGAEQREKQNTSYVIHEQIHWMLLHASANNCIRISRDSHCGGAANRSIHATVRHLSVTSDCLDQLKEYSIRLGNLRTLLVLKGEGDGKDPGSLISAIDKDILEQLKGVRVLDLTGTCITQLPENIGKLKHVRYLGIPDTISSNLCDQVTKLLFLQTLTVIDKSNFCNTEKKSECITNISGIGRLVKLRESIEFQVMRGSEKEGHGVSELAGMNSLGETLTIKGLDAISSKEEAGEAQLGRKYSVKILKLEWGAPNPRQFDDGPSPGSSGTAADPAAAVLQGLQPHGYIQDLRITRYPGETSPTWLSELEKLTRLYLKNCRKLKALPVLGGLPCLELLDIKELTVVVKINGDFCGGGAFPKLKKIVLDDMEKLVTWDDMPKLAFPVLRDVSISDCPRLSSLSGLGCCRGPINLRVKGCPAITQVTLPANFNGGNSTCKFY